MGAALSGRLGGNEFLLHELPQRASPHSQGPPGLPLRSTCTWALEKTLTAGAEQPGQASTGNLGPHVGRSQPGLRPVHSAEGPMLRITG